MKRGRAITLAASSLLAGVILGSFGIAAATGGFGHSSGTASVNPTGYEALVSTESTHAVPAPVSQGATHAPDMHEPETQQARHTESEQSHERARETVHEAETACIAPVASDPAPAHEADDPAPAARETHTPGTGAHQGTHQSDSGHDSGMHR